MRERLGIFVDGQWHASSGSDIYTVINPTTEEPYGITNLGTDLDVDRAVISADRALRSAAWRATTLDERCAMVERIALLLAGRTKELARIQAESMGGLYRTALALGGSLQLIEMYLESVREVDFEYVRSDRYGNTLITRQPVGVVAGIVPWNAPVRSEVKKVVPALLAGCTVVLKPAPETPFGAAIFAEICAEAGVPPGVVNLVPGGPATGEALVRHPLVRKIAFTGSTATGARIASLGGESFKRLQLELGGKSAAILLDDVDIEAAVPWLIRGNWGNSGQVCTAITRVLTPRRRYADVLDALAAAASEQVVGDPLDDQTTLGPLVTERQRDKVLGFIAAGVNDGAQLVTGGGRADLDHGWFVQPTVFSGVDNAMRIATDEIFGPVTSVIPYDSEDDAVEIANDSRYGLHGAVFARDEAHALQVARRIDTGSVAINGFYLAASAPFGGIKQSGIGREHGPEGYDSFLEYISYNIPKTLADRLSDELARGARRSGPP